MYSLIYRSITATVFFMSGTSLWEAPLFTMTPGAEKSLCQSLRKYKHRATDPEVYGRIGILCLILLYGSLSLFY